jgi:hypothetical protein
MEFLYSLNWLNVATLRAQAVVIVVGSPRLLEPECRSPRQMQLANALCQYAEMAQVVETPSYPQRRRGPLQLIQRAAVGCVHCCKERCRAVAFVIVRHGLAASLLQRKTRLCAIQCLI